METLQEEWRPVNGIADGYPYEVSNFGRVRNLSSGYVLSAIRLRNGYRNVTLSCKEKRIWIRVHRLVLSAFDRPPLGTIGQCQVNHKDGNKANNHIDNLEWVTSSENHRHAYRNGLRSGKQYLSPEIVRAIRASTDSPPKVAKALGIAENSVRRVRYGERHTEVA